MEKVIKIIISILILILIGTLARFTDYIFSDCKIRCFIWFCFGVYFMYLNEKINKI